MPVTVEQLCARYHVDVAHAGHVAAMSLDLFDRLPHVHRLPPERRRLLETAAILHNIAYASDPKRHDVVGRDRILAETLSGFTRHERDMIACTTRFHRKQARPDEEPVFRALPAALQKETLALAALLRVGDAFDYSQAQTCRIVSHEEIGDAVRVVVEGPHADEEAARANRKADLWNEVFPHPLTVLTAIEAAAEAKSAAAESAVPRPKSPAVRADDPIAVTGCKVLQLYFSQLRDAKAPASRA